MTEQDLIPHYNKNPNYWSPVTEDSVDMILDKLGVELTETSTVADIGCGDGRLLKILTDKYDLCGVGIDYSPVRIEKAKEINTGNTFFYCDTLQEGIEHLRGWNYDYGFLFEVLEHLEQPRKVLNTYREYCDVLAGSVPIQMPYKAHLQVFESVEDVEQRLDVDVQFTKTYNGKKIAFWTV